MSHVENDENRGVGGRGNEVDRKKIPRVSSGMGEMKCELRKMERNRAAVENENSGK